MSEIVGNAFLAFWLIWLFYTFLFFPFLVFFHLLFFSKGIVNEKLAWILGMIFGWGIVQFVYAMVYRRKSGFLRFNVRLIGSLFVVGAVAFIAVFAAGLMANLNILNFGI